MNLDKHLKVGDRAQLAIEGVFHNTIISDILDERTFLITDIWYKQVKIPLNKGDTYPIVCITTDGLIMFDVKVEGHTSQQNLTLVKVMSVSEPSITQRRSSYRVKIMLDVNITEIPESVDESETEEETQPYSFKTMTVDISESGMQVLSDKEYALGEKLLCSVDINKFGITANRIEMVAEVRRCRPAQMSGGQYRTHLRFMKLPESVRSKLARFIVACQVRR